MKKVILDLENSDVLEAIEREILAQQKNPLPERFPVAAGTYARVANDGYRIAYTPSQEKLFADKQWVKDAKDYLNLYFEGDRETIELGLAVWGERNAQNNIHLDHFICQNADEIVGLFNTNGIPSCMSIHSYHQKVCDAHPAETYDTEDFAVVGITYNGQAVGRLITNRETKEYVRLYLIDDAENEEGKEEQAEVRVQVRAYVKSLGYVRNDDAYEGCKLKKIEENVFGTLTYVLPYVDFRESSSYNSRSYSLDDNYRLTKENVKKYNDFCLLNTSGIGLDVKDCESCGNSCIETHDLEDMAGVCKDCFDNSHSALIRGGNTANFASDSELVYVEETRETVHEDYLDAYLSSKGLVSIDGEIHDEEDTLEIRGTVYLKSDLTEYTDCDGDTQLETDGWIRQNTYKSPYGNGYFEDEEMRDEADEEDIEAEEKEQVS